MNNKCRSIISCHLRGNYHECLTLGFCKHKQDKQWYLIEYIQKGTEQSVWWTGLWFSADIEQAARFPIKEHAKAALERLKIADDMDPLRLTVTEHLWVQNS